MKFIADLHVHSKYSRATAKNLDLEHLYQAAKLKGINVVGTGDFTFPAWVEEISEKLEPAEPGFFKLKPSISEKIDAQIPSSCNGQVRFILQTEISNIYKKKDKVRKNHNLIFFPDIDSVKRFNLKLGQIGNITSDGRPILGLDAADLLEIMLETNEQGFFVPAHIWTPWFSMFGSKSGFDSMNQCFGNLASHIFAVETGLSSDPPMNQRVADLDNVTLISNSDAHSPGFLGRNATIFNTELNYFALKNALETGESEYFQGTYDMYPHQGKYHYDGHRKCNICLNPEQTIACKGLCPECGRPLTLGVLHRVQELADRPEGFVPKNCHIYEHIVPLKDILSETLGVGPNTKKVAAAYEKAIACIGPELSILVKIPMEKIAGVQIPLLANAIEKIRKKEIHIDPGYDGEYGKVKIFSQEERQKLENSTNLLFPKYTPISKKKNKGPKKKITLESKKKPAQINNKKPFNEQQDATNLIQSLNKEQEQAVFSHAKSIVIQAGPGTGKTRTLTAKIAWLISEGKASPENILALTFTSKAARELTHRIQKIIPDSNEAITAATFHSFCLQILRVHSLCTARPMDAKVKTETLKKSLKKAKEKTNSENIKILDQYISQCKQKLKSPINEKNDPAEENLVFNKIKDIVLVYQIYQTICSQENLIDFEGIIFECIKHLSSSPNILSDLQKRFTYIFVDEFQDVNLAQYELIKMLSKHGKILVIGDKDQSIYGFRGSNFKYFTQFENDYLGCKKIVLSQNYRSTQTILDASWQMISRKNDNPRENNQHTKIFSNTTRGRNILIKSYPTDSAEITGIGKMIESLVGGFSFFSFDARSVEDQPDNEYSFKDIAILCRTKNQCKAFAKVFDKQGIPCQNPDLQKDLSQEGIDLILECIKLFLDKNAATSHFVTDLIKINEIIKPLIAEPSAHSSVNLLEYFTNALQLTQDITGSPWFRLVHERLIDLAYIFPNPIDFMDNLAIIHDQDILSRKTEKISIMTIHTAKGLEFPVVFVAGCENGLIPFSNKKNSTSSSIFSTDVEEEKRLFYVAMTRAKDLLYLTHAEKRKIYGKIHKQEKSCFLKSIEKELTRYEKAGKITKKKNTNNTGHIQMELF